MVLGATVHHVLRGGPIPGVGHQNLDRTAQLACLLDVGRSSLTTCLAASFMSTRVGRPTTRDSLRSRLPEVNDSICQGTVVVLCKVSSSVVHKQAGEPVGGINNFGIVQRDRSCADIAEEHASNRTVTFDPLVDAMPVPHWPPHPVDDVANNFAVGDVQTRWHLCRIG